MSRKKRYWLFKSEPSAFSIDALERSPNQTSPWDGVRNYQARNFLRDDVQVGDEAFFYHSREEPLGIFGVMRIVRAGYPDATQFQPHSVYYDAKASVESPRWIAVDVQFVERFAAPVDRAALAEGDETADMLVLKRGMRLSIQPVEPTQWRAVLRLARRGRPA